MSEHLSITLHPYKIELTPRSGGIKEPLDDFGKNYNLIDIIKARMTKATKARKYDEQKKAVNYEPWAFDEKENIHYCEIRLGLFGAPESEFYDSETDVYEYTKKTKSKEVLNIYFCYYHVKGAMWAYVIMEKIGKHSCKEIIQEEIQNELDKRTNSGYKLRMEPCPLESVMMETIKQYNATEVRLTKNTIPADACQQLGVFSTKTGKPVKNETIPGKFTIVIHPSSGYSFAKFGAMIDERIKKKERATTALKFGSFEPDTASIICDINGKKKTFKIGEKLTARPSLDITDTVERFKSTNLPKIKSIHSEAVDLLAEMNRIKSAHLT